MLEFFLVLGFVYLLYMTGMKHLLRYRLSGNILHDIIAYTSFLALGGVVSVSATLPLLKFVTVSMGAWELAILPTGLAIVIGEICYNRNKKWTTQFVERTMKAIERYSRTKRM